MTNRVRVRASAPATVGLGLLLCLVVLAALTHVMGASAAVSRASAVEPASHTAELAHARPKAERPNIVLITTDDQNVDDMRVMHQVVRLLGRRGTTFTKAFSPYPVCCPARATILTGQYAQNHHVLGNHPPWGGFHMLDDTNTLPLWLQAAGYRTIILGKYLNGYPDPDDMEYVPPGWDEWRVPTQNIYNYGHWTLNKNGALNSYRAYETAFVTHEAVSMIDSYADDEEPFFMWTGYLAPHGGGPVDVDDPKSLISLPDGATPSPAPKYQDALRFLPLPDKASINEPDVSDKPEFIRNRPRIPVAALRELDQQRKESLLSVDDGVSRILAALKAHGELDNTVVIFTSDNGFLVGEHRKIGKHVLYEESVGVPMIVAGPGFDTAAERSQKVSLVDLAPTIAQLAGATPQLTQDGVPLQTFAADANAPDSRAILLRRTLSAAPGAQRRYVAIRTNRYVYGEYDTGELELYDLRNDPLELVNRAGRPRFASPQQRLAAALAVLKDCAGATCLESPRQLGQP